MLCKEKKGRHKKRTGWAYMINDLLFQKWKGLQMNDRDGEWWQHSFICFFWTMAIKSYV